MRRERLATEVRREQIAAAALALVSEQGLQQLSMAAVARRVGVVASALYRHFESKDALVRAVIELVGERLLANVREATGEAEDSVECLEGILLRHVALIRENAGIPRIVFSEGLSGRHGRRRKAVHDMVTAYLEEIGQVIRRGQQAGRIRKDPDPGTLSVMFLGLVQPPALLWHLSDGRFDVTKQAERAWKCFRSGILEKRRP